LTHHAYRQRTLGSDGPHIPTYTGLDFHHDGLIQSRQTLLSIQARLSREALRPWPTGQSIPPSFFLGDLDGPLPLADNSYDAVFCHMVLGHFADPLSALREYFRILVPGGRLVVLSLQPTADLSTWYRHQLSRQAPATGSSSGALLRAFGEFHRSYLEGVVRRFTHRQMELLLGASGGRQPMVEPALSDQVHIATARKPNSTG
jgi:SAM-dependent methyltransferase